MRNHRITSSAVLLFCAAATCPGLSMAQGRTEQPADNAEALLEQWISIEQQRTAMESRWSQSEQQLQLRIRLLQAEKEGLEATLQTGSDNNDEVEEERRRLLQRQDLLEQEQAAMQDTLATLIPTLQTTTPRLPPPLFAAWQTGLESIETAEGTSEQLNIVLQLLRSLNDFQERVSSHESVITLDNGESILARQLYLGAAFGWFVTEDGSRTGLGSPASTGWRWRADNDVSATTLKRALEMLEVNQDIDFVELPVVLQDPGVNL